MSSNQDHGLYATEYYHSLLSDGQEIRQKLIYTEKELSNQLEKIFSNLRKIDDWQSRIEALEKLHALAIGDACKFDYFANQLKYNHDLVYLLFLLFNFVHFFISVVGDSNN